jgi:hypothetical protein
MGLPAVPWDAPPLDVLLYLSFALLGAYLAYLLLAQLPRTLNLATTTR